MKNIMRKLNMAFMTVIFSLSLCIFAFAEGEVKYSNELTSSPLRILFAILIIPAFIAMEIAFEKIREKRIEKRNKSYEKEENK